MIRMRALTPLALAACLLLTACGSSDDDKGGGTVASTTTTGSGAPNALSIVTTDRSDGIELTVSGSARPGVATIDFRNDGRAEHEAQLIRVEGDHGQDEVLEVLDGTNRGGPLPDWFRGAGGPGTSRPGAATTVTERLEPGTYFVVDTNGPEGRGAKPNYRNGGVATFEVRGEESDATAPSADATVTAREYGFTAHGLRAGPTTIDFVNHGKQPHHLLAFPLLPGRTVTDVRRFIASERGAPPIDFRQGAGTTVIDGGTSQQVRLDLRRGRYVLICFVSDRRGGPPHATMGMITEADVE